MSDDELFALIQSLDNELINQGTEPWQRMIIIESKLSEKLRVNYIIRNDVRQPLHVRLVRRYFEQHYRKEDLEYPPMHVGSFMFMDLFFPVRIPLIYGSPTLDMRAFLCGATDSQRKLIFGEQTSLMTFLDQAFDLLDFVYGLYDAKEEGNLPKKQLNYGTLQSSTSKRLQQPH